MLVISRRKGQRVTIGDEIELVVTELHRSSVKLGIKAPRGYTVLRGEIHDSIETANREAAKSNIAGAGPLTEAVVSRDFGLNANSSARQRTGASRSQHQDTSHEHSRAGSGNNQRASKNREPQVYVRQRPRAVATKTSERPDDTLKSGAT